MSQGAAAASKGSDVSLVELERELEALLVEYESLSRAWPKEPCILTRAKIGRRVENALAEIQRLQDTITGEAPVARDVVKEAHQDRREVRVPRSLHHLPACRGRDPEGFVRGPPAPH